MRVQEILTKDLQKRYIVVNEHGELVIPVIRYLKYLNAIGMLSTLTLEKPKIPQ